MDFNYSEWRWLHVLCQDMDRARALTIWLLASNCEWDQLVSLRCDPSEYVDLNQSSFMIFNCKDFPLNNRGFRYDYQITELLRKCADLPVKADPKRAAIDSFWAAEDLCATTNKRMYDLHKQIINPLYRKPQSAVWIRLVDNLQNSVKQILGGLPEELLPKFSSGSTFDDRRYIFVQDKMSNRPTSTYEAYTVIEPSWVKTWWCKSLCSESPNRSLPKFVLGNRFTTVPKTALTDRGICVEPSLNVTHQLSVGRVIRKRLRRFGIDLKHGQAFHRKLVEEASSALDLGTIDLSSASDTVSLEFVRLALAKTPEWLDLLETLRSPFTKIEGKWHRNHKFSSMGNGFTFELETLLFYALGVALCNAMNYNWRILTVYGDDIIIDSPMAEHMTKVLRFFGFKINATKTYVNNIPFRESCGADFYKGQPVRGHYIEFLPKEPTDWIKLANGLRRMARSDTAISDNLCDYHRSWVDCVGRLPKSLQKVRGPEHLGDVVLHDPSWRLRARVKNEHGRSFIKAVIPQFNERDYSSYDRVFWNRGAILGAALGGFLLGQGDTHNKLDDGTWKTVPGRMLRARSEPVGYQTKWIEFTTACSEWLPSHRCC